jgi:hypothetical protein
MYHDREYRRIRSIDVRPENQADMKIKIFFHYYRKVLVYNLLFTATLLFLLAGSTLISGQEMTSGDADRIASLGLFMFLVTGTAFGFMVYRIFRGFEYPFYFNLGFLPRRLKLFTAVLNTIVTLVAAVSYYAVTRWIA